MAFNEERSGVRAISKEFVRIAANWADKHSAVVSVSIFGSVVRGDTHVKTDVDVLLKFAYWLRAFRRPSNKLRSCRSR